MTIATNTVLGFIGLGVMGEPMCRNIALKSGCTIWALDLNPKPLARLQAVGVKPAVSIAQVAEHGDIIFLSLPSGHELEHICAGPDGLLSAARKDQIIVDLGTSPVKLSQQLGQQFADLGACYIDAPVARTRAAAEAGTLSIMVGASESDFNTIKPWLEYCASELTCCGPCGSGQLAKLMNNMVLFQTVVALSEAVTVAQAAGMDAERLLHTLSKGSADSFALRNHGLKAIVPEVFPERAFSTDYARKDLAYALALAGESGLQLRGAELAQDLLQQASANGDGDKYFPCLVKNISKQKAENN